MDVGASEALTAKTKILPVSLPQGGPERNPIVPIPKNRTLPRFGAHTTNRLLRVKGVGACKLRGGVFSGARLPGWL